MNISDILRWKSSAATADVHTIAPDEPVTAMLRALAEHNVGALVVVESEGTAETGGRVVGVVSERDIVRRLGSDGAAILERPIREIMTAEVLTCAAGDSIDSIAETMTSRRVRHMPVLDGARLIGIVSIGDVVSHRMRQLEKDRGQLEQYISG